MTRAGTRALELAQARCEVRRASMSRANLCAECAHCAGTHAELAHATYAGTRVPDALRGHAHA
eukprot:10024984-Alexandrium_andersonii.AAC.1